MTWKEKIRFCIDILFKGRDIKEELNAVERERIKLGEKMKKHLELLINDDKPSMISSPDASMIEKIQIAEIGAMPVPYPGGYMPRPIPLKPQDFRLEIVEGKYAVQDHPYYITKAMEFTYYDMVEHLSEELIRRKLVRVETLENPEDRYAKILRFSVNVYKGV